MTEAEYRDERAAWPEDRLRHRVVLAADYHGRGALAWLANSAVPVWLGGKKLNNPVEYTFRDEVSELAGLSDDVWEIDGWKAQQGKLREETERLAGQPLNGRLALMLVQTTVCGMACSYCYAGDHSGDYEKVSFDTGKLAEFLKRHGHKFGTVIVYGGDSLMDESLPEAVRTGCPSAGVNFVTGLGYAPGAFERRIINACRHRATFTLSIDPPPQPGKPYSRIFKLYPTGWYEELGRRVAWMSRLPEFAPRYGRDGEVLLRWGLRPSVTQDCYNHRQLREDLVRASGWPEVSMNLEPAVGGWTPADPDGAEALAEIDRQLDADVADILEGRLSLHLNKHFGDPVMALLNPCQVFSQGGCYQFLNRISLGPRGEVSFCNEVPTYEADRRSPWLFGSTEGIDGLRYASAMEKIARRPTACQRCDHRHTCGTHCPIKLESGEYGGCLYARLRGEKVLRLAASLANVDTVVNDHLEVRLNNLRRWSRMAPLTVEDLARHGSRLLA